jgi:predicted Zn finger-like uncharacterized protein
MDIRCEKCQTEYELDESRLKAGAVTVKCTHCGHMFKIRKRSATNVGAPVVPKVPLKAPQRTGAISGGPTQITAPEPTSTMRSSPPAPEVTVKTPATGGVVDPLEPTIPAGTLDATVTTRTGDATVTTRTDAADMTVRTSDRPSSENDRVWMVRFDNGEQKTCRDLATLQQWIVAGLLSRESLISRSGKTWKRLGDIGELSSYFVVAEQTRVREKPLTGPTSIRTTTPGVGAVPSPRPATVPPPIPPRRPNSQLGLQAQPPPSKPPSAPPSARAPVVDGRSTASWATDGVAPTGKPAGGLQGPSVGNVAGLATDPGFGGRVRPLTQDDSFGGRLSGDDSIPMVVGNRGRIGKWIAFFALAAILVSAGVMIVVLGKKPDAKPAPKLAVVIDAAAVIQPVPADATVVAVVDAAVAADAPASAVELALQEMVSDVGPRLRAAWTSLQALEGADAVAVRVRIATVLAQALADEARLTNDKTQASRLQKESQQLLLESIAPLERALKAAPTSVMANVAKAELLRLQGKSSSEGRKYLSQAKLAAPEDSEVLLASAMFDLRDGKRSEALSAMVALEATTPDDMRPAFQAALLHYTSGAIEEARARAAGILAIEPDHAAARALSLRLAAAVNTADPMPPEEKGSAATSSTTTTEPAAGDSFDRLLARGQQLAESDCEKAIPFFQKALDKKPNSVEALTAMGYCHVDAKQFASAQSKFRAALAISPRNERGLWGVAEAYAQQGLKERAIESFQKYLEVYPGTGAAQRQIDRLMPPAETSPEPTRPTRPDEAKDPAAPGSGAGAAPAPAPPPAAPATEPAQP